MHAHDSSRWGVGLPVAADAEALARVHVDGWRFAYAGLVPPEMHGPEAFERRRAMWTRTLTDPAGDLDERLRIVRDADGAAAGFCFIGGARDDDAPAPLELQALYVREDLHGSGAASALVDGLLGARAAYLWVADPNPRAQAFYAKKGFAADGSVKVDESLGDLREIRMVRGEAGAAG